MVQERTARIFLSLSLSILLFYCSHQIILLYKLQQQATITSRPENAEYLLIKKRFYLTITMMVLFVFFCRKCSLMHLIRVRYVFVSPLKPASLNFSVFCKNYILSNFFPYYATNIFLSGC